MNTANYARYLEAFQAAIVEDFDPEAALRACAMVAASLITSKMLETGLLQEGTPAHEILDRITDRLIERSFAIVAKEISRANRRYGKPQAETEEG